MTRTTKIFVPVLVLVLGLVSMFLLLQLRTKAPRREPEIRPKMVNWTVANPAPVDTEVRAQGRIISAQPVKLYAEVNGTLESGDIEFRPARDFRRGQILARIDDRQAEYDLNSAKSDFLNALAQVLPEIKLDFPDRYDRWQEYFNTVSFDQRVGELPEADNPKIKLFLSRFNVYKLYFAVRDLEVQMEKHVIRAPFDGSVVSAELRTGSTVRSGSLLGEIINLEDLELELPVSSQDIGWIDYRKPVTLTSQDMPGTWGGTVKRVGSSIETRTQTVPVYVAIDSDNKTNLLNGLFMSAVIPGIAVDSAVLIPRKAIHEQDNVYVVREGKLDYVTVQVIRRQSNGVIVTGGLNQGDTLVIDALQGVSPGMPAIPLPSTIHERGE